MPPKRASRSSKRTAAAAEESKDDSMETEETVEEAVEETVSPRKRAARGSKRATAKVEEEEEEKVEEEEKTVEDAEKVDEENHEEKVEAEVEAKSEQPEVAKEDTEVDETATEKAVPEEPIAASESVAEKEPEEPPVKKSKIAEEAIKKIEEAKAKIAEEALKKIEDAKAKMAAVAAEATAAEEVAKQEEKAKEEAARQAKKAELEKFWKAVKDDPADFTGWTYLLQHVDSKNDVEAGREAFSKFLQRYPYCYGYWKKFSDFEKRNGSPTKTMEVFDQGLAAIPLSADLWIHLALYQKSLAAESGDREGVRDTYERAVKECGREWRSDKLWDHYVKWETEGGQLTRVWQLYQRIVTVPTQGVANQLEAVQAFVKAHNPKDLVDTNEFLAMRKDVLTSLKGNGTAADAEAAPGENDATAMANDEETEAIREKMMFGVRKLYKETEERVKLRWKFEEGVKRPYFHVKPLERGQLKNWRDYLDFMKVEMVKEGGDITELEILYERSLIACALYEEFWLDYVQWWQDRKDKDSASVVTMVREIYSRASRHLPTKVELHCSWAAWEEKQGCGGEAGRILEALEEGHPRLVTILLRRVNLERRRGNEAEACKLYEAAIQGAKTGTATELSVKYSRFLRLARGDSAKAAQVLQSALDLDPSNPKLYLQQLDLALHTTPLSVPAVVQLLDTAQAAEGLADKHKLLFAQRKVEFLQDFGPDITALEEAELKLAEMQKKKEPEKTEEPGKSITTIQGRGGKEKTPNGAAPPTSYPPTANTPQYQAAQTAAFNQYGARYSGYPAQGSYGQWGYPGYAPPGP